MKKLLLLLILSFVLCGCDEAYNLSDIDTENTTIGDETTDLDAPLASLTIRMSDLTNGQDDIQSIFEEVDIWLPALLPGGAAWIDIVRLQSDPAYLESLLSAFFTQTANDPVKLAKVASLGWNKYQSQFIPLLPFPPGSQITEALFTRLFIENFSLLYPLQSEINQVASGYLKDLKLKPLSYDVGKIDLSTEVVDMLVDNLDPKGTKDPKNTLDLYGAIVSNLPLGVTLNPDFLNTDVDFEVTVEGPDVIAELPRTRLYAGDLRAIMSGTTISIPIQLDKYYPGSQIDTDMYIRITLKLNRKGGLKLKL